MIQFKFLQIILIFMIQNKIINNTITCDGAQFLTSYFDYASRDTFFQDFDIEFQITSSSQIRTIQTYFANSNGSQTDIYTETTLQDDPNFIADTQSLVTQTVQFDAQQQSDDDYRINTTVINNDNENVICSNSFTYITIDNIEYISKIKLNLLTLESENDGILEVPDQLSINVFYQHIKQVGTISFTILDLNGDEYQSYFFDNLSVEDNLTPDFNNDGILDTGVGYGKFTLEIEYMQCVDPGQWQFSNLLLIDIDGLQVMQEPQFFDIDDQYCQSQDNPIINIRHAFPDKSFIYGNYNLLYNFILQSSTPITSYYIEFIHPNESIEILENEIECFRYTTFSTFVPYPYNQSENLNGSNEDFSDIYYCEIYFNIEPTFQLGIHQLKNIKFTNIEGIISEQYNRFTGFSVDIPPIPNIYLEIKLSGSNWVEDIEEDLISSLQSISSGNIYYYYLISNNYFEDQQQNNQVYVIDTYIGLNSENSINQITVNNLLQQTDYLISYNILATDIQPENHEQNLYNLYNEIEITTTTTNTQNNQEEQNEDQLNQIDGEQNSNLIIAQYDTKPVSKFLIIQQLNLITFLILLISII